MKKIIYFVALATIFMFGCSKEKINEQQNNDSYSSVKLITLSDGSKTSITMLEFSSINAYDSTIKSFERQMERLDDAFLAQYDYLNDSLLNEKEEDVGFIYQQPLIDFENSLNFTNSMRQVFVVAEENWLDNDSLDMATDPSNTYIFSIAEMAMLNTGGEVKIGTSLLKLVKDGFVVFTDSDINKLIRFNNGDMTVLDEVNVVTSLNGDRGSCTWWKGKNYPHYYANKKKVIRHVHFHAYPWKGVSKAKITSYKKRGSKWKKYRTNLGVANQSYLRDRDCDPKIQGWTGWKYKRAKSIKKGFTVWGAFPGLRAENGKSVYGRFVYPGNSNTRVLAW
jgi:hypothetical protein